MTVAEVKALLDRGAPTRHADGNRLYLVVTGKGRGWWMFRYTVATRSQSGKPLAREMGLGPADPKGETGFTLAQARERAADVNRKVRDGIDPLAEKDAQAAEAAAERARSRTFREVADLYLGAHAAGWQSEVHRQQWRNTLATYAHPRIGDKATGDITTEDVLGVLQPIWMEKPETASRVRGRVEAVLNYAGSMGWRMGDNPARWRGHLSNLLLARGKVRKVQHHPALPWQEIGAFMVELRKRESIGARALEFLILAAARTSEVIGAKWSEINLKDAVWVVPAERMKMRREHRVPLSVAALSVLHELVPLQKLDGEGYVFPGQKLGEPLSDMAMLKVLERMGRSELTVHGFRSTCRTWIGEATATPNDVAEAALAHINGDKVEAAYQRGDLFQKRRVLMDAWAEFCGKAPAENVVSLRSAPGAGG